MPVLAAMLKGSIRGLTLLTIPTSFLEDDAHEGLSQTWTMRINTAGNSLERRERQWSREKEWCIEGEG